MAKLFDVTKEGKGVSKEQVRKKKGLMLFLDIYFRRFWKLINLNLIYMITSLPFIYVGYKISQIILAYFAFKKNIPSEDPQLMAWAIPLCWFLTMILIHFCGAGPTTAGFNHILSRYVKDTHAWVWKDFVQGMKDNWKQAIAVYFINTVLVFACSISLIFYGHAGAQYKYFVPVILVAFLYFLMMQMYTYRLMVGFKLTLKQIYKNAAILTLIKLPRNMSAFFVCGVLMWLLSNLALVSYSAMFYFLFFIVMLVFFALFTFVQLFMTRDIVQKYMIDIPQQERKKKEKKGLEKDTSPIFEEKDSLNEDVEEDLEEDIDDEFE